MSDKLLLMANEKASITWAKLTAHGNTRCLNVEPTVECEQIGSEDQFSKAKEG